MYCIEGQTAVTLGDLVKTRLIVTALNYITGNFIRIVFISFVNKTVIQKSCFICIKFNEFVKQNICIRIKLYFIIYYTYVLF